MARELIGSLDYPLTERIRDGIAVHGLRWAVRFYTRRMPLAEARVLLRLAYCHGPAIPAPKEC